MKFVRTFFVFLLLALNASPLQAADNPRRTVLHRMFGYARLAKDDYSVPDSVSYAYTKFSLSVKRRNILLAAVPTMYAISRGRQRDFFGETYSEVRPDTLGKFKSRKLIELSTVPRRSTTLPSVLYYLTPHIYSATMISDDQLSPFCRENRCYYRYKVSVEDDSTAIVAFTPRLDNTLLMTGEAKIDVRTGRVMEARFKGEYDMVRYTLYVDMGRQGNVPSRCNLESTFRFLGNQTNGEYAAWYGLKKPIARVDTVSHDISLMEQVRPEPLAPGEESLYTRLILSRKDQASVPKKKNMWKYISWDLIGENLLTQISEKFGPEKKGYVRINPILNPLYMGYNPTMGVYYKMNIRGGYQFTPNSNIWLQFKCGYSFKLNQFYFKIPITWYFDQRHGGYVESNFGNGNRITNSRVIEALKAERGDSVNWDGMNLDYFKDQWWTMGVHYDLNRHWGVKVGFMYHRRAAVNPYGQMQANLPRAYVTFAPNIELTYRPLGFSGPILTALYESSYRGLANANVGYQRLEIDGQYKLSLGGLKSLQMRLGEGFYFDSNGHTVFLDYSNFRQTTIPDGWNDEWSGDFELLNGNWYNASQYYVRGNFTYESPILLTAWIPIVGHVIERERIYVSSLLANKLHPYTEIGYGIKTRLMSIGIFSSFNKNRYESTGIRAGFELFREW